jgi:glycosyltransferase involved in cell wall biosynthesis
MKLNKKKEYKNIQYFFNNRSINSRSELIQKIKLSINNLINFKEIRVQRSFEKLKDEISVLLFSFNHQTTIKKTLESILAQKTSIPVKIYCFDDGSKDETQKILKEYENYYKEKIKVIFSRINTKLPLDLVLKSEINFNSKYWCLLDGDDYWIDDYNLQKKIEVLVNNEKLIGCSSITKMISKDNVTLIKADKQLFNKTDITVYKNMYLFYCHTSSLLWKNYYYDKKTKLPFPCHFGQQGKDGDTFLFNQMLNKNHQIYVIQEVLSIYNFNNQGAWSSLSKQVQEEKNKILQKKIFYYSPFKYKILYLLTFFLKFTTFKKNKIYKLFFKILRTKPVNIL